MQADMPTPPARAEWKPPHMPRLSYRNSATIDPSQLSPRGAVIPESPTTAEAPKSAGSEAPTKLSSSTGRTGGSGNALRPTNSRGNDRSQTPASLVSPTTQKKKGLFGGLFVTKEPTALALGRLAAQLEAQHGELSARAIPGVSSSQLPEHVPKVNSKWDGVPEALKERERLQKEKARTAKRRSLDPSTRSRSTEDARKANSRSGDRPQMQKRSSSSTLSSFDSRGRAEHQRRSHLSSSDIERSTSKTPSSDPEPGRISGKPPSTKSQSLRSPSGSSLPPITAFFPNDIQSPPAVPTRYKSEHSTRTQNSQRTESTGRTQFDQADALAEPTIDVVPEYTSSPVGTPIDRSPVTPSPTVQNHVSGEPSIVPILNRTEEAIFVSSGPDVLGPPATAGIKGKGTPLRDAFLAGEAHPLELPDDDPAPAVIESDLPFRRSPNRASNTPALPAHARVQQDLEKRPDSSRARLGLRASMLVRAGQAPWDWQDLDKSPEIERSTSPRLSMPVVPKTISKVLGKANK